jgi:hypothetical protein
MPIPASGPVSASAVLTEFAPFQPAPATYNPPSIPANARLRFLTNTYNPATPSIPLTNGGNLPFSVYKGKNGKAASVPVQTYTLTSPGIFVCPNTGTLEAWLVGGGGGGGLGLYPNIPLSGGGGGSGGGMTTVTTTVTAGASIPYTIGAGGGWGNTNGQGGGGTSMFGVFVAGGNGGNQFVGGAARAGVNKGGDAPGYSGPTLISPGPGRGGTGATSPGTFGSVIYGGGGGAGCNRGTTFAPSPFPNAPRVPNNGGNRGGCSGRFFYREPGFIQGGTLIGIANSGGGGGGGSYYNSSGAIWGGDTGMAGVILVRI